jgi:hypothetical protein
MLVLLLPLMLMLLVRGPVAPDEVTLASAQEQLAAMVSGHGHRQLGS